MAKSNLTLNIELQAIKQFSKFGVFLCPEVSFQRPWIKDEPANCSIEDFNFNPKYMQIEGKSIRTEIVDLLESNSQKGWVCYEIKISKSDFHSKAIKSFVGNYNYYLIPANLYHSVIDEIPLEIGVYIYDNNSLKLVKKAKKQKIVDGIDEQLSYGMIRSLARERDEKFEKTRYLSLHKLREYVKKLNTEYENISNEYWNIKHNGDNKLSYKEEIKKITELKLELDIIGDIKDNLSDILNFI